MKLIFISDTHGEHNLLNDILWDEDHKDSILIHSGDGSNSKHPEKNLGEATQFLLWMEELPIKHKIYVPGNHDKAIYHNLLKPQDFPGIHFLIHEAIELEKIQFFGSPYTPTFGTNWAYNINRSKIAQWWEEIPKMTDVLITHGPPKGILDNTAASRSNLMEQVGCKALLNRVKKIVPKVHAFGHIHDEDGAFNNGIRTMGDFPTKFINSSIVSLGNHFKNNPIIYHYE